MTSSIPAVLDALAALARTTLTSSQIIAGPYTAEKTTGPRILIVGDGDITGRSDLDSMGGGTAGEQYTVPLTVSVGLGGTEQRAVDALALADYAAMATAIRADLTLGLTGTIQAKPAGFVLRRRSDANGCQSAVLFNVDVIAQTT